MNAEVELRDMLLDDIRKELRIRHHSHRTEEAYVGWIRRFIIFNGKRHPEEMGESEIESFLAHLAVERHVSASTQNQAMCAVLFLYKEVLKVGQLNVNVAHRAQRPVRLPVVLSRQEVRAVSDCMTGAARLISGLLYGAGLRLMEGLTLRVKDLDFWPQRNCGSGRKGAEGPRDNITRGGEGTSAGASTKSEVLHERDLSQAAGRVALPDAIAHKYPNANREWVWPPSSACCALDSNAKRTVGYRGIA
jgi:integrase